LLYALALACLSPCCRHDATDTCYTCCLRAFQRKLKTSPFDVRQVSTEKTGLDDIAKDAFFRLIANEILPWIGEIFRGEVPGFEKITFRSPDVHLLANWRCFLDTSGDTKQLLDDDDVAARKRRLSSKTANTIWALRTSATSIELTVTVRSCIMSKARPLHKHAARDCSRF
jgi:hypothetical protein